MLEKVCRHIHNFFVRSAYPGTYTIIDGILPLDFVKDGQRVWIVGSDLNDGVYTWHPTGFMNDDDTENVQLKDEEFNGTILTMAPPKEILEIVDEIAAWNDQYGEKSMSPFQSESVIGVYSYQKGSGSNNNNGSSNEPVTWESAFAARLQPYRRTGLLL